MSPACGAARRWVGLWRAAAALFGSAALLGAAACNAPLPDPDSPGARLYASRCNGDCHRLYAPGSMKPEMWRFQVERMQGELVRRGLSPLSPAERDTMLEYLQRHAG